MFSSLLIHLIFNIPASSSLRSLASRADIIRVLPAILQLLKETMRPLGRGGHFDADKLAALGLTSERMKKGEALFSYQLLLPIIAP